MWFVGHDTILSHKGYTFRPAVLEELTKSVLGRTARGYVISTLLRSFRQIQHGLFSARRILCSIHNSGFNTIMTRTNEITCSLYYKYYFADLAL